MTAGSRFKSPNTALQPTRLRGTCFVLFSTKQAPLRWSAELERYVYKGICQLLKPGNKVRLKAFNNTSSPPEGCDPSENYWALIGEEGTIKESKENHSRVLVQFDKSVSSKGLHCHNKIENSLLILNTDLEVLSE